MILLDTSAWIEYLRATGSEVNVRVRAALLDGGIAVTDPVVMEVLAGARSEEDLRRLSALLGRCAAQPCVSADYRVAAEIRRACRVSGASVRNSLDCLIAAVAIRRGIPLLHADRDFETIANHSALELA